MHMLASLKRGWILVALTVVLVIQFVQFFRTQRVAFSALTAADLAAALSAADPADPQRGVMAASLPNHQPQQPQQQVDVANALLAAQQQQSSPTESGPPLLLLNMPKLSYDLNSKLDAPFDYTKPAVATEFTLPSPKPTNQSTIVLCFSARDNFERRAVIRETWAKGNDNVFFAIGGPVPGDMEDMNKEDPLSLSNVLFKEQEMFGDIIDTIHPDTYRGLPYKLHFGMRWIMKHHTHVDWVVKADDDVVVRVKLLQFFVLRKMNPHFPQVIGTIAVGSKPHRTGKWAEDPKFTDAEYPPWAFGSSGYVVSAPVANYVAQHDDLYYYQGEDAGLGIWMHQSGIQVTWVDTPELRKEEGCQDKFYIIGHDMSVESIRNCFQQIGDTVPERPHIIAFTAGRKDQFPDRIRNYN